MRLRRQAKTTAAPTAWRLGCSTGVDRRDPAFQQHCCLGCGLLTVKLRGRTTTSDGRRGRTLSSTARGAQPQAPHGPLQRLLDRRRILLPSVRAQWLALPIKDAYQGDDEAQDDGKSKERMLRRVQIRDQPDNANEPDCIHEPALPGKWPTPSSSVARCGKPEPRCVTHAVVPRRSNGEVEGPRDGARLEPRAEHLPQRPRRHYRASRPPPTIVRRHSACGQSHLPPPPPLPPRRPPPPSADTRDSQPEAVTILQCCDRAKH